MRNLLAGEKMHQLLKNTLLKSVEVGSNVAPRHLPPPLLCYIPPISTLTLTKLGLCTPKSTGKQVPCALSTALEVHSFCSIKANRF